MTIITVQDAQLRKERGWDFPGYPEGVWTATAIISHDASGGQATFQVNLQTAGVPEGNAFSIEAFDYRTNNATSVELIIQAANFDFSAGVSQSRGYRMDDFALATGDSTLVDGQFTAPWFLGVVVDRTIASSVSIVTPNITGKVSVANISGYYWTPRSILQIDGGYRRPADGMFPN